MIKLAHQQHIELARLLNQATDNLQAAARIVDRAAYSDRVLYVNGTLQEWLIDPLHEAWEEDLDRSSPDNPYQNIGYGGPHRRKKPPSARTLLPRR